MYMVCILSLSPPSDSLQICLGFLYPKEKKFLLVLQTNFFLFFFFLTKTIFLKILTQDICLLIWEGEGGGRDRQTSVWERNICWLPLIYVLTGDRTRNLGVCPDWASNLQPFWFTGRCSNQLSHLAMAPLNLFNSLYYIPLVISTHCSLAFVPSIPTGFPLTCDSLLLAEFSISFIPHAVWPCPSIWRYLDIFSPSVLKPPSNSVCSPWMSLPTLVILFINFVYVYSEDTQIKISKRELFFEVQTFIFRWLLAFSTLKSTEILR